MDNELQNISPEYAKWICERILQANDVLLQASRQGGFLAVAILAASSVWIPTTGPTAWTRFAMIAVAISIACAALAHFFTGHRILGQLIRMGRGQEIQTMPGRIVLPWAFGIAQGVFLLFALAVFVVYLW